MKTGTYSPNPKIENGLEKDKPRPVTLMVIIIISDGRAIFDA